MRREFDAVFAGRKVKCKCGNIGVVPERPEGANIAPPTNNGWWLSNGGSSTGPHNEAYILSGLKAGAISPQTNACAVGGQEWKQLAEWPTFAAACPFAPPPSPTATESTSSSATTDNLEDLAAAMTGHSFRGRSSAKSSTVSMKKRRKSSWPAVTAILGVGVVVIAIIGYGFIGGYVSLNTLTPISPQSASENAKETNPVVADPHVPDKKQVTHIEKPPATKEPSDALVEAWVKEKGGNVNNVNAAINDAGTALIHLAAHDGRVDVLTWLKKQGADVNAKVATDLVPIHFAAINGHVNAMKWLKEQGANVNAKDTEGRTPMLLAAVKGHVEAMRWLKEQGADVNTKIVGGTMPIHLAAIGGNVETMKCLKELGADVNAKDMNGWTPMHFTALQGHFAAMKWLKEQGADVNAETNQGSTPLSFAKTAEAKAWLRTVAASETAAPKAAQTSNLRQPAIVSQPVAVRERVTWSIPVANWGTDTSDKSPFRNLCQVLLLRTENNSAGSSSYNYAGVAIGPAAKDRDDNAYADFKNKARTSFDKIAPSGKVREMTEKIGNNTYDRYTTDYDSYHMLTVLVGVENGRCTAYWFAGRPSQYGSFKSNVGKATIQTY